MQTTLKTLTRQEIINNPSILVGKFEVIETDSCNLIVNFYYKKDNYYLFYFRKIYFYDDKKTIFVFDHYDITDDSLETWPQTIYIL